MLDIWALTHPYIEVRKSIGEWYSRGTNKDVSSLRILLLWRVPWPWPLLKSKHLIAMAHLECQWFRSFSSWWRSMVVYRQMWCWSLECHILQASTKTLGGILSKGNLKTYPHSDTFVPMTYLHQRDHSNSKKSISF